MSPFSLLLHIYCTRSHRRYPRRNISRRLPRTLCGTPPCMFDILPSSWENMYGPLYDGWYEPDCFFFLFSERGNPLIWFLPPYNPSLWSSLTVIVSTCTWRRGQSNSLKWSFSFPYFWGGKEGEGGARLFLVDDVFLFEWFRFTNILQD